MTPHPRPHRGAVLRAAVQSTPVGAFACLVDDDDHVAAAGFTADPGSLRRLLPPALRDAPVARAADAGAVSRALAAYFAGHLTALDGVAVTAAGTAYQQRAWAALRALPAGAPVSYGELAARIGSPRAARAAGGACGRNPTALVVPCHRVVRGDGSLGGFAWGLEVKRWLLDHERRSTDTGQAGVATATTARSSTKAAGRSPLLISTSAAASVR